MAKRFACWVGRHRWTTRIELGESYKVCSECGRPPRRRGKAGVSDTDLAWQNTSGQSDKSISDAF